MCTAAARPLGSVGATTENPFFTVNNALSSRAVSHFKTDDREIDLIMQYRLGIAMMGLAVIAVALLARPIAPEWSAHNRSAVAMMVIGGIILVLLPTLAAAIVGP